MGWIIYFIGIPIAYGIARHETKQTHPEHWKTGHAIIARLAVCLFSVFVIAVWLLYLIVRFIDDKAKGEWPDWL